MSYDIRAYDIAVTVRCPIVGRLDERVYFLCALDRSTNERSAIWNGCDDMGGSAECYACHKKMVEDFKLAHPEYQYVV